ncbi:hypothetical protein Trydic_g4067 [Trypoxylus dichotomus]
MKLVCKINFKMNLFRYAILFILFGLAKSHGRIIMMAVLGLMGLWMAHLLAQDYQNIRPKALISTIGRLLSKRSVNTLDIQQLRLDAVINNDPLDCVKSFLCQAVAQEKELDSQADAIVKFFKDLPDNKNTITIKTATKIGEVSKDLNRCRRVYDKCPYTAEKMRKLIKIFGG